MYKAWNQQGINNTSYISYICIYDIVHKMHLEGGGQQELQFAAYWQPTFVHLFEDSNGTQNIKKLFTGNN